MCESVCESRPDSAQPAPPSALDGKASGPAASESPEPGVGAATANVGASAATAKPAAPQPALGGPAANNVFEAAAVQALIGEPNAWTVKQFCKKCQVDVLPVGKGECPRCHCALRLNFRARRHPVNVTRRDQLYADIVVEYRPTTLELRDACRYLANVKERLESTKDGTPEHQRLMAMWSELSVQLRTATHDLRSASAVDLAKLTPQQQAERAEALAKRLREIADREAEGAAYIAAIPRGAGLPVIGAGDAAAEPACDTSVPAPDLRCAFCHGSASGCAAIRDDPWWLAQHALRADIVARLEQQRQTRIRLGHETTTGGGVQRSNAISYGSSSPDDPAAEMMRQIGRPLPDWYD